MHNSVSESPDEARFLADSLGWPVERVERSLRTAWKELAERRANGTYVPFEQGNTHPKLSYGEWAWTFGTSKQTLQLERSKEDVKSVQRLMQLATKRKVV